MHDFTSALRHVLRPRGRFVVYLPADGPILLAKAVLRTSRLGGLVRGLSLDPASFDGALASAVVDGRFRDGAAAAARRAVAAHTCEAAAEALLAAARGSLQRDDVPSLA